MEKLDKLSGMELMILERIKHITMKDPEDHDAGPCWECGSVVTRRWTIKRAARVLKPSHVKVCEACARWYTKSQGGTK